MQQQRPAVGVLQGVRHSARSHPVKRAAAMAPMHTRGRGTAEGHAHASAHRPGPRAQRT
jgi:hypothetical protein